MRVSDIKEQLEDGFVRQQIASIKDLEGNSLEQYVFLNWQFDRDYPEDMFITLTYEDGNEGVLHQSPRVSVKPGSTENFIQAYTALLQLVDRKAPFYNLDMREISKLKAMIVEFESFDTADCADFQAPLMS